MHASLRPHVELRPHQKEGVERMIFMEKVYRGGILADDVKKKKVMYREMFTYHLDKLRWD